MNKKIFSVAILSILLLAVSVSIAGNPAFHETQFTSNAGPTAIGANFVNVPGGTQFVSVPLGGAELTATFSAVTQTGAANQLRIRVLDNGVVASPIPPGIVIFDQNSEEDGFQAHSFTFGKTLTTAGVHNITVQAQRIGGGAATISTRSFETEIEELP